MHGECEKLTKCQYNCERQDETVDGIVWELRSNVSNLVLRGQKMCFKKLHSPKESLFDFLVLKFHSSCG